MSIVKPSISMYDVPRKMVPFVPETSNEMETETVSKEPKSKESLMHAAANFKAFIAKLRSSSYLFHSLSTEANDSYCLNLNVKYRRNLTLEDVETLFKNLISNFVSQKRKKSNWGEEEIQVLIHFVRYYCLLHQLSPLTMKQQHWIAIADMLPQRSADVCKEKWMKVHHINIHDAPWTPEEDERLVALITRLGFKKWTQISRELNQQSSNSAVFRQAKQCRERWVNHLDPSINKGAWALEEDINLLQTVLAMGKRWSEISKRISNRTENAVKNRWKSLLNKHRQEISDHTIDDLLSSKFESILSHKILEIKLKEAQLNPDMFPHGVTSPASNPPAPAVFDLFLDGTDEGVVVNTIPTTQQKNTNSGRKYKKPHVPLVARSTEDATIKSLNAILNNPTYTSGRSSSDVQDLESSFSNLSVSHFVPSSPNDKETPRDNNNVKANRLNLRLKTIAEVEEEGLFKDLEDLEICLFSQKKNTMIKAMDARQKAQLHALVMAMISSEAKLPQPFNDPFLACPPQQPTTMQDLIQNGPRDNSGFLGRRGYGWGSQILEEIRPDPLNGMSFEKSDAEKYIFDEQVLQAFKKESPIQSLKNSDWFLEQADPQMARFLQETRAGF